MKVWNGTEWEEIPDLVVDWDKHSPANKWKHLCKVIGHKWKPSHPHYTYCDRCGMGGYQRYETSEN